MSMQTFYHKMCFFGALVFDRLMRDRHLLTFSSAKIALIGSDA